MLNGNLDELHARPGRAGSPSSTRPPTRGATGGDSIPLTGHGNAGFAEVGSDGLLYVMNTGDYFSGEGRLSVVDPARRTELASYAGFGTGPGNVASDGGSHRSS